MELCVSDSGSGIRPETLRDVFNLIFLPGFTTKATADMLAGRSALTYRAGITMGVARNGAHLSSGPIEALREVCVWFGDESAAAAPAPAARGRLGS